jgi:hypothetical protein
MDEIKGIEVFVPTDYLMAILSGSHSTSVFYSFIMSESRGPLVIWAHGGRRFVLTRPIEGNPLIYIKEEE